MLLDRLATLFTLPADLKELVESAWLPWMGFAAIVIGASGLLLPARNGRNERLVRRGRVLHRLPGIRGHLATRKAKRFAEHPSISFNEMIERAWRSSAVRLGLPHSNQVGIEEAVVNAKAREELTRALCDRFVKEHPESCQRVGAIHTEEPYAYTKPTIRVLTGDFESFLAAESAKALAETRPKEKGL